MLPFIIDCDTGRDDALSIWLALSLKLPLIGILPSYGNTTLKNVTDNCQRVLALLERDDIPVLPGAAQAGKDHIGYRDVVLPRQEVSGNGVCNIALPKTESAALSSLNPKTLAQKITTLYEEYGQMNYAILGPATNFSNICDVLGEDVKKYIKNVIMMGGKLQPEQTSWR